MFDYILHPAIADAAISLNMGNIIQVLLYFIGLAGAIVIGDKLASSKMDKKIETKASVEYVDKEIKDVKDMWDKSERHIDEKINAHEKNNEIQFHQINSTLTDIKKGQEKIIQHLMSNK